MNMRRTIPFAIILLGLCGAAVCQAQAPAAPATEPRCEGLLPEPVHTPLPEWIPGTLEVDMIAEPDGSVFEIVVVKSSYNERLTKAALDVLHQWRFTPAPLHGHEAHKLRVEINMTRDSIHLHIPCIGNPHIYKQPPGGFGD